MTQEEMNHGEMTQGDDMEKRESTRAALNEQTSPLVTPRTVQKPWGREIWYADAAPYAGKVLEVRAGHRLSLQKHQVKEETLYLLSGRVKLTYLPPGTQTAPDEATYDWRPGQAVHILPGTVHRFEALVDSVLLEVSTPHLTDVIRLDDDYQRE